MKIRALMRRERTVIIVLVLVLGLGLIAVNAAWPAGFAVFVAIGGIAGAFVVLYEVRLTKRIAQAEFIRDLQSGFQSDPNIGELWRKLLLKEAITSSDRALISSYLTFFETLHLLSDKGALELSLTDDLFRNRFFTAIGNKGVLGNALVSEAGSFANIHRLIAQWHGHLLDRGIPIPPGYYAYVEAVTEAKGFTVVRLDAGDLTDLLDLQRRVIDELDDPSWLRANSDVMLKECLSEHVTLGVRREGNLVAAAVLYDGATGDESIKKHFTSNAVELNQAINLKLVLTLPEVRREGLARTLVELLEQQAADLGKSEVLCTIAPKNAPSKTLFRMLGYRRVGRVTTTYGKREVFARELPKRDRHWAR